MKWMFCILFLIVGVTFEALGADSVTVPTAPEDVHPTGGSAEAMLTRKKPIPAVRTKKARIRAKGSCVDENGKRFKVGQDGYSTCLEQAESGESPVSPGVRAHAREGVGTMKVGF